MPAGVADLPLEAADSLTGAADSPPGTADSPDRCRQHAARSGKARHRPGPVGCPTQSREGHPHGSCVPEGAPHDNRSDGPRLARRRERPTLAGAVSVLTGAPNMPSRAAKRAAGGGKARRRGRPACCPAGQHAVGSGKARHHTGPVGSLGQSHEGHPHGSYVPEGAPHDIPVRWPQPTRCRERPTCDWSGQGALGSGHYVDWSSQVAAGSGHRRERPTRWPEWPMCDRSREVAAGSSHHVGWSG